MNETKGHAPSRQPQAELIPAHVASKIPLVHVCGRVSRWPFDELVFSSDPRIPSSLDTRYVGDTCRAVERDCGIDPSTYFYAGRADPRYGDVTLSFSSDWEQSEEIGGDANPFDTGYVYSGVASCNAGDHGERIGMICSTLLELSEWRTEFANFLSDVLNDPLAYWYDQCPVDVESYCHGLLSSENEWNAWTWEIRLRIHPQDSQSLKGPLRPGDCDAWGCSREALTRLRRASSGIPPSHVSQTHFSMLLDDSILVTPRGDDRHCDEMETWIVGQFQGSFPSE